LQTAVLVAVAAAAIIIVALMVDRADKVKVAAKH
jgi:hypothetical protein